MNISKACAIIKNINANNISDDDKALAIYIVMNMATHNGITKAEFLEAVKWLWNRSYEVSEEE